MTYICDYEHNLWVYTDCSTRGHKINSLFSVFCKSILAGCMSYNASSAMLLSGVTIFICAAKLTKNVLQWNNKVCLPSSIWPESVESSLILTGFGLALSPSVFSIWNDHATTNKTFCWYRNFTTKFNNFVWISYHGISDFIISSFQVCKKVISLSQRLSAKKMYLKPILPYTGYVYALKETVFYFSKNSNWTD